MKNILAAVISLDGKITKHGDDDLHSWVSQEDQSHFEKLLEAADAVIIGSNTYELMRGDMTHLPGRLRLVLTSRPDEYIEDAKEGLLEFLHGRAEDAVDYLEKLGKKNVLIAGGEQIMTDFLSGGLVDEIYITIEPKIFGQGVKMISQTSLDIDLKLIEVKQLNKTGSLLLHYAT